VSFSGTIPKVYNQVWDISKLYSFDPFVFMVFIIQTANIETAKH
jgi:hypothetical protein